MGRLIQLLVKMKIAIAFFVCFVAVAYQERIPKIPLPWLDPSPAVGDENRALKFSFSDKTKINPDSQARFFWPWNFGSTSNYLTSTQYVTVSSTLTSIIFSRCVPASLFAAAANQASTCRRRRRAIEIDSDIPGDDWQHIAPSRVEPLMATAVPSLTDREVGRSSPDIESSAELPRTRGQRTGFGVVVAVVTSTITSYSVTTTTMRTTAQLATTSAIFCLPFGYTVC